MILKMIVLSALSITSVSQTHAADCISFLPAGRNLQFWDDMESEVHLLPMNFYLMHSLVI